MLGGRGNSPAGINVQQHRLKRNGGGKDEGFDKDIL